MPLTPAKYGKAQNDGADYKNKTHRSVDICEEPLYIPVTILSEGYQDILLWLATRKKQYHNKTALFVLLESQ